eukprot:scaffold1809_cov228-Pinguiococcus_pyrenoidosus.AAC.14
MAVCFFPARRSRGLAAARPGPPHPMRYYSNKRQRRYGREDPQHVPHCAMCGRAEDSSSNLQQGELRRLLTSTVCGHRFCEDCRTRHFLGKIVCPVPDCGQTLTKSHLVAKDYLDILAEKDDKNRREVRSVYNKFLGDFGGDKAAYDQYLEEAEDLIYNLSNGIDVDKTRKKLEERRRLDAESIRENQRVRNLMAEEELKRAQDERLDRERRERRTREEAEEVRMAELEYQKQLQEYNMGHRSKITAKSGEQVREEQRKRRQQESSGRVDLGLTDLEGSNHATSMASMWLNPDYKPDIRNASEAEQASLRQRMQKRKRGDSDRHMRQLAAKAAGYFEETMNQVRRLEVMSSLMPLVGKAGALKVAAKLRTRPVRSSSDFSKASSQEQV